jgi:hypothetical protein
VLHPWHFLSFVVSASDRRTMNATANNLTINAIVRKGATADTSR